MAPTNIIIWFLVVHMHGSGEPHADKPFCPSLVALVSWVRGSAALAAEYPQSFTDEQCSQAEDETMPVSIWTAPMQGSGAGSSKQ